jgi:hypothetical protein
MRRKMRLWCDQKRRAISAADPVLIMKYLGGEAGPHGGERLRARLARRPLIPSPVPPPHPHRHTAQRPVAARLAIMRNRRETSVSSCDERSHDLHPRRGEGGGGGGRHLDVGVDHPVQRPCGTFHDQNRRRKHQNRRELSVTASVLSMKPCASAREASAPSMLVVWGWAKDAACRKSCIASRARATVRAPPLLFRQRTRPAVPSHDSPTPRPRPRPPPSPPS